MPRKARFNSSRFGVSWYGTMHRAIRYSSQPCSGGNLQEPFGIERDGATGEIIGEKIAVRFKISVEILERRQRGGLGSEARKAFAYSAVKEFLLCNGCEMKLCIEAGYLQKKSYGLISGILY